MRIQVIKTKVDVDWSTSLFESCFEKQMPVQVVGIFLCFDVEDYDGLFKVWFHALREYSKSHTWEDTCRRRHFRVAETGRRFWIKPVRNENGVTFYNAGELV